MSGILEYPRFSRLDVIKGAKSDVSSLLGYFESSIGPSALSFAMVNQTTNLAAFYQLGSGLPDISYPVCILQTSSASAFFKVPTGIDD